MRADLQFIHLYCEPTTKMGFCYIASFTMPFGFEQTEQGRQRYLKHMQDIGALIRQKRNLPEHAALSHRQDFDFMTTHDHAAQQTTIHLYYRSSPMESPGG